MIGRAMDWWSRVRERWLWRTSDEEIDEELRFHIDMSAQRNVERGMPAHAARRDALLRFGGLDRTRESARDAVRLRWLEDAWHDARHGVRQLRRSPGFGIAAVCTLALGIGANTAIFSVLDAVLLRPLPYTDPAQLVSFDPDSYENYLGWTEGMRTIASSGAYTYSLANVVDGVEPVRVWTLAVTASLLPTLGRAPMLGRGFTPEDDIPNAPRRVLLRYGFWRAQFAADSGIVGRTVEVNGAAHEVIGVLPPELEFPPPARQNDGSMPRTADVWTGVGWLPDLDTRGGFRVIARLAPGATVEAASAELTATAEARRSAGAAPRRVPVIGTGESVVGPLRPAVLAFAAGVALVLLIACANLGGLLLARMAGRQRELAVRVSLGAPRGRIVRQILMEGAVLAGVGGLVGIAVGWLLLQALLSLAPPELARVQDASLNARVLGFTVAVSVVAALLIGVLPAWRAARRDPREALGSTRGTSGDRQTGRVQAVIVACEVAFAVVLLVGGGLLVRSFATLASVSPGFDTEGLITADLLVPSDRYETRADVLAFLDRLEERLEAHPGVRSASGIDRLPYAGSWSNVPFEIVGRAPSGTTAPHGYNTAARPGYFRTIGIPMLHGREFEESDRIDGPRVVVIGRALADRYWPDENPIGQRIEVFGVERVIVGIAANVRHLGPLTPVDPLIYLPQAQDIATRRMMTVVVRAAPTSPVPVSDVRAAIRALDPTLPISNLSSFDALRAQRTASERFNALLVASFGALAALLAAVGIYGIMSYIVAQRTREIGVRMALGASRGMVLNGFLGNAMGAVIAGVVAGIGAALPLSWLVRSMLFGIATTDALTYVGVVLVVLALAVIAALVPARRAASVAPSVALAGD